MEQREGRKCSNRMTETQVTGTSAGQVLQLAAKAGTKLLKGSCICSWHVILSSKYSMSGKVLKTTVAFTISYFWFSYTCSVRKVFSMNMLDVEG